MKIKKTPHGTQIWATQQATYDWAHRCGSSWPCSTLSDKALFVELDRNGDLVDLEVNHGRGSQEVDGHELNAFIEDARRSHV